MKQSEHSTRGKCMEKKEEGKSEVIVKAMNGRELESRVERRRRKKA